MAPKLKFAEGEKVLCFHGPLIYEAKCLKSSVTKDKHVRYLIHYAGWNKNWDEWVPESRVLKYNDANVQRQKEVQKAHSAQPAKTKKTPSKGRKSEAAAGTTPAREESRSSTPAGKEAESATTPARAVKRQSKDAAVDSGSDQSKKKRDHLYSLSDEDEDDEFMTRVSEIKVKIPYELKVWLVDDYCAVTREQKIVNVPSKITVEQIINNYLDYKTSLPTYNENTHSPTYEISEGIKDYFNATLEPHLLHYNERPQYNEILEKYPNKPMVQIYGPIHLLRLFTRIGAMLSYSSMDEESLQYVFSHIEELINYMWENREMLMNLEEYVVTTPEYRKKIPLSSPS